MAEKIPDFILPSERFPRTAIRMTQVVNLSRQEDSDSLPKILTLHKITNLDEMERGKWKEFNEDSFWATSIDFTGCFWRGNNSVSTLAA